MEPCVAVIHATRAAVTPIEEAFNRLWPEADTISLLDESLSVDLEKAGELTPALMTRVGRLARFAKAGGADAILFSCSAFGEAIESARSSMEIPVLKLNEAMLEEALAAGSRIRLVATFEPSIRSILKELGEMSAGRGQKIEADVCFVPDAMKALASGDRERHDTLIVEAVSQCPPWDVVMLGQFSMASALSRVAAKVASKVLTSPHSAVARLKEQFSLVKGPV